MGLPTYVNMLHHVAQITTCLFEVRTSLTALLQCLMLPLLYPFPTSISASQLRVGQSYAITRSTLVFLTVVKIRLCVTVQRDNYVFLLLCCVIRSSSQLEQKCPCASHGSSKVLCMKMDVRYLANCSYGLVFMLAKTDFVMGLILAIFTGIMEP